METLPNIEPLAEPTFKQKMASYKKYWTSREGWIGDYVCLHFSGLLIPGLYVLDHAKSSVHEEERSSCSLLWLEFQSSYFPRIYSWVRKPYSVRTDILRFQHALAMLAGIVTPPLILGGAGGANFDPATQQYLISASLIVCGILSSIQITRFHLFKTPYYLGTGLIRYISR